MSVPVRCATCDSPLTISNQRYRRSTTRRWYCDHACRSRNPEWRASKSTQQRERYASGNGFSPEARARMSVSACRRRPTWRPRIEAVVEEELLRYEVPFTPQAVLRSPVNYDEGGFAVRPDFLVRIGEVLLAIELNGTFFHADRRRFPDRDHLTKTQERNLVRYERKLRLYQHLGIQIRELWELENDCFLELLVFPLVAELCCLDEDFDALEATLVGGAS